MKFLLTSLMLAATTLTSGCALFYPDHSAEFKDNDLQAFAYDLGQTHAGLARCPQVSAVELDAHLESAQIALKAQSRGHLADLEPAFELGLQEPARSGQRLFIQCDCAKELVKESRMHNLRLYREVATPRVLLEATR